LSVSTDIIKHLISTKICTNCKLEKPLFEFSPNGKAFDGFQSWCVKCTNDERTKKRNTEDGKRQRRDEGLRRWYGVTVDEYEAMLEKVGYKCEVCGSPGDLWTGLHLDHDHKTNKPRGILCGNCNRALGNAMDDIEILKKLIAYLEARK
jgi:hypothetical protein